MLVQVLTLVQVLIMVQVLTLVQVLMLVQVQFLSCFQDLLGRDPLGAQPRSNHVCLVEGCGNHVARECASTDTATFRKVEVWAVNTTQITTQILTLLKQMPPG